MNVFFYLLWSPNFTVLNMLFFNNIHGCESGLSLLERLMTQNTLYQKNQDGHQGYDSCFVTKLLRNYR